MQENDKKTLYQRPLELQGSTFKIKPSTDIPALYVTINKGEDGRIREVFVNTGGGPGDLEFAMVLGRIASAVCRMVDNPEFLVKELMDMFGEAFWAKTGENSMMFNGRVHAVGWCLMKAMEKK
ncbi:MAG: hypothetical protein HQL90_04135 [Magnetococcales bacterium]|nr:hypothetical protein [Magnetococcales bacterium]